MPRIERDAEIVWEGNLARGEGRLSAASSGAFSGLPISVATRVGAPEGRTSPEELLAAAHGGCFATSLAGELTGLGHPPARLELSCRIVMDEVAGDGHQIVGSEIVVAASVPGIDAETLARAVVLADEGCPFSSLLKRGGADVSVRASLLDAEG
jgi:osmotically inducible protein OsmC